jgi:hypothetical protein
MPQFFCYGRQKNLDLQLKVPKAQMLVIVEVVTFTLNPMILACVYVKVKKKFRLVLWTWTFVDNFKLVLNQNLSTYVRCLLIELNI